MLKLLKDVNVFKFFVYDVLFFEGILFDLFFGVVLFEFDYFDMIMVIRNNFLI